MSSRLLGWLLSGVYLLLLALVSPWIVWQALTTQKYREGFAAKFLGVAPIRSSDAPCIWLHAVSVGEVNLLSTLIDELRSRLPGYEIVVSTTTKTGYDLAIKKYAQRHQVFYCPLDFTWSVRRAMRRVRPTILVLAELELWPNLIAEARASGACVAVVNGRLSENSFRGYRRAAWLIRRVVSQINVIAAQDEATAQRFRMFHRNPSAVQVTGSLKYDGAITDRNNSRSHDLATLANFSPGDMVFLAGSTQAPEEKMALEVFCGIKPNHPALKLVLVPRHPERFDDVAQLLADSNTRWARRSELLEEDTSVNIAEVLLVDTVGELGAWWGTATIGLVGGSFGDRGGQNMIEPAALGVATCFGPNTKNFREIVAHLLATDGACVVANQEELRSFVERCLADADYRHRLGHAAQTAVRTQLGATDRTVNLIASLLPSKHQTLHHEAA